MTLAVNHRVQRHATEFEQVDFLFVDFRNPLIRIGQAWERQIVFLPVLDKLLQWIRTDGENFSFTLGELVIPVPQARQLRAAIRSHEAAQEG